MELSSKAPSEKALRDQRKQLQVIVIGAVQRRNDDQQIGHRLVVGRERVFKKLFQCESTT